MYPVVEKPGRAPAYAPWMAARLSSEGLPEVAAGIEEAVPQQEQPAEQSRLGRTGLQEPQPAAQVGTIGTLTGELEPRPAAQVGTIGAAWGAVLVGACRPA